MAGDWIPVEVTTPRKAEVIRIAKKLGIPRRECFGGLVELWAWAQDQSVDGRVDATVDACETAVDLPLGMCREMVDLGWLEDHGSYVVFPNWGRWLSSGAKSRLHKSMRQKKWRKTTPDVDACVDGDVDAHVDINTPHKRLPEESTVEYIKTGGTGSLEMDPNPSFTSADVKNVLAAYPLQQGVRGASYAVSQTLVTLHQRGQLNPVAHLLRVIATYSQSDMVKRGKTWSPKRFFDEGHYDDDPSTWGNAKPPPSDTPEWVAPFNDSPLSPEDRKIYFPDESEKPHA